jgi:hypothetical protein
VGSTTAGLLDCPPPLCPAFFATVDMKRLEIILSCLLPVNLGVNAIAPSVGQDLQEVMDCASFRTARTSTHALLRLVTLSQSLLDPNSSSRRPKRRFLPTTTRSPDTAERVCLMLAWEMISPRAW